MCGKQSSFRSVSAHTGMVALTKSRVMRAFLLAAHWEPLMKLLETTAWTDKRFTGHEVGSDGVRAESR